MIKPTSENNTKNIDYKLNENIIDGKEVKLNDTYVSPFPSRLFTYELNLNYHKKKLGYYSNN